MSLRHFFTKAVDGTVYSPRDLPAMDPNNGTSNGQYSYAVKDASQSFNTTGGFVDDMSFPCKFGGAKYVFDFEVSFTTVGLLAGVQFAVGFSGTVTSLTYGLVLSSVDNSVLSAATTIPNTFLGTGATLVGGGPRIAHVSGILLSGGTVGGDLILSARATGVGASVTVNIGTSAWLLEI